MTLVAGFTDCERLSSAALAAGQRRQLTMLLQWATDQVPWYTGWRAQVEQLSAAVAVPPAFWSQWRALPTLTKADLRQHALRLHAPSIPPVHHPASKAETSGSTGTPIALHRVRELASQALGYPYRIDLVPVASLPPGPGGKFEGFLSLL